MAPYSPGFPTDFDVPALASVIGVLVIAAATKGGYPLWAIGAMIFLYVLFLRYGARTCHELGSSPLADRR